MTLGQLSWQDQQTDHIDCHGPICMSRDTPQRTRRRTPGPHRHPNDVTATVAFLTGQCLPANGGPHLHLLSALSLALHSGEVLAECSRHPQLVLPSGMERSATSRCSVSQRAPGRRTPNRPRPDQPRISVHLLRPPSVRVPARCDLRRAGQAASPFKQRFTTQLVGRPVERDSVQSPLQTQRQA